MSDKKEKILAAAIELFTQKGFAGTSIGDIAKLAKINQSLIYHHIGNKEALWKEVKKTLVQNALEKTLNQHYANFSDFLSDAISQRITAYEKEPRLIRLIQWQMLEEEQHHLMGGSNQAPTQWVAIIALLQEQQQIKPHYPPELIALYLHSLINGLIFDAFNIFKEKPELTKTYLHLIKESCLAVFST